MEMRAGVIDDFFKHVSAVSLKLETELAVGDTVHIKGHMRDITLRVESMQIDHQFVQKAKKGDSVGIKIAGYARRGDVVFKVT
jgi:putative protease